MAHWKRGKQKMKGFCDASGYDGRFVASATRSAWVHLPKLRRQLLNQEEQLVEIEKGADESGPSLVEYLAKYEQD
jgi:hypothetical protein